MDGVLIYIYSGTDYTGSMPKGSKKDRQVKHITDSYVKRGYSKKRAEEIAYAVVNKKKSTKKKKK